jgi:hypothetical protein
MDIMSADDKYYSSKYDLEVVVTSYERLD